MVFRNILLCAMLFGTLHETSSPGGAAIIRQATVDDIPAIISLARESPFVSHWSEAAYRTAFEPGAPARLVLISQDETAGTENRLQGFVVARAIGEECELEKVVVAAEFQHRGVGTQLIHALIQAARERRVLRILLEVRESNTAARSLYEKLGFEITSRRHSYYNDPTEDAVLYALGLKESGD
jgi:ribosomal-protein-alanine acetyltransferase